MTPQQIRARVAAELGSYAYDWAGFVRWAFPWGVEGGPLANEDGPDAWQIEQLDAISSGLREGVLSGLFPPQREATSSGHGIGKSALVCWLILAGLMTYADARCVVTANTDTQLRTKTWAELSKWFQMLHPVLREMFTLTATALYSSQAGHEKTWRADAIPWSASNPAAFAGLHNAGKRAIIIMDEASEIVDVIWDTAEGATTDKDTEVVMAVFGNPTAPTGRFKEVIAGRFKHLWRGRKIDSRTVKRTNKVTLGEWERAFGEDSDFFRVRVRGEFPRVGMTQFIPSELVTAARKRATPYLATDPLILGVDVAWFGDDRSMLVPRRGNDARTIPWQEYRGADPMFLAGEVAAFHARHGCDAIFVDVTGIGAGVYARLLQLEVPNVFPVNFGGQGGPVEFNGVTVRTANLRAAMWSKMREWLRIAGAVPDDADLDDDLCGVQYAYGGNGGTEIILEKKEHMRARGLASPDKGDGLGLTFAMPVMPRPLAHPGLPGSGSVGPRSSIAAVGEYDIYADLRG